MTTAGARSVGEAGLAATTFSYAEAAKGRATSATVVTLPSSQVTSGSNTPSKESNTAQEGLSGIATSAAVSDIDRSSATNGEDKSKRNN